MKIAVCLFLFVVPFYFVCAQDVTGVYETDFNEMTLQQTGTKITGTYKHRDGRIEGTLQGRTLNGWWYQSNGKGKFVFEFSEDFMNFTGKWNYNEAIPSGKWNGKRKDVPLAIITGIYATDFGEMTLQQSGVSVKGSYTHRDGRIEATLQGRTLTGWWYQSNGKGKFVFEFNEDYSSFTGKWSYNEAVPSGKWNGKKIQNK